MKKNMEELRKKTANELEKMIEKTREEIARLKVEQKLNPIKDTNLLIKKRKLLARALTVLTEKKWLKNISAQ